MKRDLDLARRILQEMEQAPPPVAWLDVSIEGYSDDEISYHVWLLFEAGFIDAINLSNKTSGFHWKPKTILWSGHDFLEAAKDESRWQKAKEIVKSKGGGLAFDVLKEVLINLMKTQVLP